MTPKDIKKIPLSLIVWDDIVTENSGWLALEDIDSLESVTCFTPGWIVREDGYNYYIVQNWGEHKGIFEPAVDCTIPKGCVRSIVTLRKRWNGGNRRSDTGTTGEI